jgi:hypothetical protein
MSRRGKGRAAAVDDSVAGIKRNDKGGILVDDTELKAAFEFFDVNSTGKITLSDLKVIQRNANAQAQNGSARTRKGEYTTRREALLFPQSKSVGVEPVEA